MICFVHDFIALDVNGPVSLRIDSGKRFVGLDGEYTAVFTEGVVPGGLDDAHFGVNIFDQSECVVGRIAHCHHNFVTEG